MRLLAVATAAAVTLGATLVATTPLVAAPVAVLVAIPVPAALSRPQVEALFEKSVPQFQQLPGLIRKYYTIGGDNRAGGIYLYTSRAAAEAHFSEAWKAGVLKQWGRPAEVTYFDVPVAIDGKNPDGIEAAK